jgi:hypothetical protein
MTTQDKPECTGYRSCLQNENYNRLITNRQAVTELHPWICATCIDYVPIVDKVIVREKQNVN